MMLYFLFSFSCVFVCLCVVFSLVMPSVCLRLAMPVMLACRSLHPWRQLTRPLAPLLRDS